MKPKTPVVMLDLIQQVRSVFPFAMTKEELCAETCSYGCPQKLLEYIDMEFTDWEQRISNGEIPCFGDIQKVSKSSKKIYTILKKNNLVEN
jgi:hypothetical protein